VGALAGLLAGLQLGFAAGDLLLAAAELRLPRRERRLTLRHLGGEPLALPIGLPSLPKPRLRLLGALGREGVLRGRPGLELGQTLTLLADDLRLLGDPTLAELELLLRRGKPRGPDVELGAARGEVALHGHVVLAARVEGGRELSPQRALAIHRRCELGSERDYLRLVRDSVRGAAFRGPSVARRGRCPTPELRAQARAKAGLGSALPASAALVAHG
jgi:hypothetical protein